MILALKTDQPEAMLAIVNQSEVLCEHRWQAHRELSNTLLSTIEAQLRAVEVSVRDLTGIIVYQGPGSFTGLRIGITTANTLAYSLHIPIVGTTTENWLDTGREQLKNTASGTYVQPLYGSAPTITQPRK